MSPLPAIRAAWGIAEIAAPARVGAMLGLKLGRPAQVVVRILGARDLVQAGVGGPSPTYAVSALGAEVDLLHAASMVAFAAVRPSSRRAALTSGALAGGFAVAGALRARDVRRHPTRPPGSRATVGALRDRWAARLADLVVPRALRH